MALAIVGILFIHHPQILGGVFFDQIGNVVILISAGLLLIMQDLGNGTDGLSPALRSLLGGLALIVFQQGVLDAVDLAFQTVHNIQHMGIMLAGHEAQTHLTGPMRRHGAQGQRGHDAALFVGREGIVRKDHGNVLVTGQHELFSVIHIFAQHQIALAIIGILAFQIQEGRSGFHIALLDGGDQLLFRRIVALQGGEIGLAQLHQNGAVGVFLVGQKETAIVHVFKAIGIILDGVQHIQPGLCRLGIPVGGADLRNDSVGTLDIRLIHHDDVMHAHGAAALIQLKGTLQLIAGIRAHLVGKTEIGVQILGDVCALNLLELIVLGGLELSLGHGEQLAAVIDFLSAEVFGQNIRNVTVLDLFDSALHTGIDVHEAAQGFFRQVGAAQDHIAQGALGHQLQNQLMHRHGDLLCRIRSGLLVIFDVNIGFTGAAGAVDGEHIGHGDLPVLTLDLGADILHEGSLLIIDLDGGIAQLNTAFQLFGEVEAGGKEGLFCRCQLAVRTGVLIGEAHQHSQFAVQFLNGHFHILQRIHSALPQRLFVVFQSVTAGFILGQQCLQLLVSDAKIPDRLRFGAAGLFDLCAQIIENCQRIGNILNARQGVVPAMFNRNGASQQLVHLVIGVPGEPLHRQQLLMGSFGIGQVLSVGSLDLLFSVVEILKFFVIGLNLGNFIQYGQIFVERKMKTHKIHLV